MKKILVSVTLVVFLFSINLAFAGTKVSNSGNQPVTDSAKRPRFQR